MSRRLLLVALLLGGCGDDPLEPAPVDPSCTPQYEPTFDNVFANTFMPDCAVSGCHSGVRPRGDMSLDEIDLAYDEVVGGGRVTAGDPEHSELVQRIYSTSSQWRMPPGADDVLADAEKCAVALWVLNGAER